MHPRRVVAATLAMVAALATVAGAVPPTLTGTGRDDTLTGTSGRETIRGLGGDDVLDGGGGADTLLGGPGADVLRGGGGPDSLFGGPGPDALSGGPGDDLLKVASDGTQDSVSCGGGFDTVSADRLDVVAVDCERVRRALPVGTAPTPVTVEFLGWASAADAAAVASLHGVPVDAVPPGGTVSGCPASDRRLVAFVRFRGLSRLTSTRTEFVGADGMPFVYFDSVRPRDEGDVFFFLFFPRRAQLPSGTYLIRIQVEASGVYTPVGETSVTRACD